mgnify:FL=1
MFESGEVKRAEGGRATVVMRPAGGCASCNRCAGKNGRELIADNAIGAKAGDIVSVEISERSRLAAAVTVFLIPLAALALGLFLGSLISELWMFLLGVILTVLSYTIVWAADKLLKNRKGFLPVIVKIEKMEEKQ